MRLVLGVSLTASSAAWALVDTVDGKTMSEDVVALDSVHGSVHEIASATARSIQDFDMQTQHDIEGVRLTWSDDSREHGIRLRTKLRLFGFETVETVSQDAAREGLNKTARYFAPHVDLAYGAARSDVHADGSMSVLRQLAARVPIRVAAAAGVAAGAAVLLGVGLYAFVGLSPSEVPDTTAAVSTPSQSGPDVVPAPGAAPAAVPAPSAVAKPVAVPAATPAAPAPVPAPKPVTAWLPATTVAQPEAVAVPDDTIEFELASTVPETVSARIGQPHLPAAPAHLPVGPAQSPVWPAQPPVEPAQPVAVAPQFVPLTPPPPVLSSLFSALP